tara:strand:- start:192 stop:800 length:609 start_codon:yes stop_codon:yes gene_type:complete
MRNLLISIFFSLFAFTSVSVAEEYSTVSLGYTEHTVGFPHDALGTTYYSDPEDYGFVLGVAFGQRSGDISTEIETSYYSKVSQKISSFISADVKTIASMFNVMATPGENEFYGIIGGGVGLGYTMIDTGFKADSVTFYGDNNTLNFAHQFILGFGSDNYEFVFKNSKFGEVEGGSGTQSNGNDYPPDEFDNEYNSISFRLKF